MTTRPEPTHCETCKADLSGGYSQTWKGDKVTSTVCFDCARKERNAEYEQNGKMVTSLMIDASLDRGCGKRLAPVGAVFDLEVIEAAVRQFDDQVWKGGLRELLKNSTMRGHSRKSGKFQLLTYYMAGRYMLTLEDNKASITLITTDDADVRMGIQGICATRDQAVTLVDAGIKLYRKHGNLEVDREVGLL